MAENQQVPTSAAPGETLALPTAAEMDRNMKEERSEIGRRARQMADRCIAGEPVNAAALYEFGPAGQAYFFRQLQTGIARQLQEAAATRQGTKKHSRPQPTMGSKGPRPLLNITEGWASQQVERRSYEQRAYRTGGACALALTGLAIAIPFMFPDRDIVQMVLQALEGLINGLS